MRMIRCHPSDRPKDLIRYPGKAPDKETPVRFDLTDLRLFLHAVEAGSITHGATRSHLALASASERLRGMEEQAGVRLLERSRRGVIPTEAGDALAHHARLILRQSELLQHELDTFADSDRGTIRLLANTAALTAFLPDALAPWLAAHPRVRIDLHERASAEIAAALDGGLSDLGVFSAAVEQPRLTTHPFAVDRLVAVMSANHPLAGARTLTLDGLRHEAFIGLPPGSALQAHVDAHARALGCTLNVRIRMASFEGICRMAAEGVGIGIVPDTAARRSPRGLPLRRVRLSDPWAKRELVLGYRDLEGLSPAARKLAAHLATRQQTKKVPASSP